MCKTTISTITALMLILLLFCLSLVSSLMMSATAEAQEVNREVLKQRYADTYWQATKLRWFNRENPWVDMPEPCSDTTDEWLDLFLHGDGSFVLRDVMDNRYNAAAMQGRWDIAEDGSIKLSDAHYLYNTLTRDGAMPVTEELLLRLNVVDAADEYAPQLQGSLEMWHAGASVYFEQAPMPAPEERICVGDLGGEWTLVESSLHGIEPEGKEEGVSASLIFAERPYNYKVLYQYDSLLEDAKVNYGIDWARFSAEVVYKEGILYAGCPNQKWMVELKQDEGHTGNIDKCYATLIDKDTLVMYQFINTKGELLIRDQTFKRGLDRDRSMSLYNLPEFKKFFVR